MHCTRQKASTQLQQLCLPACHLRKAKEMVPATISLSAALKSLPVQAALLPAAPPLLRCGLHLARLACAHSWTPRLQAIMRQNDLMFHTSGAFSCCTALPVAITATVLSNKYIVFERFLHTSPQLEKAATCRQ
jgi:hypothetical protein